MPVFIDEETGLPGYSHDLPPEDPANPDTVPVADVSTPPRAPEDEIEDEHEGVVVLVRGESIDLHAPDTDGGRTILAAPPRDPDDIPDPDKPQPEPEEPEGDEDDNDQPSGNPEDDDLVDEDDDYSDDPGNDQQPDANPPAG